MLPMRLLPCLLLLTCAPSLPAQTFNGRTAAEWVKDLGAEDAAARDMAVRAIESMQDRAVRATLRALDDERPVVRQHAALALGRLGATAAMAKDKLIALQQDGVPEVAQAAIVAVMRVQVDAAQLPALIAALQGKDWELQLAAADVLAQLGRAGAPAAPALVEVLKRDDAALDRTDVDAVHRQRTRYRNVRQAAALALGAIGPVDGVACIEGLAAAAQNGEWAAREGAAKALAAFGGSDEVIGQLSALLIDNEWPVQRAAAEAMAKVVGPGHPRLDKVVALMTTALQDRDGGVRRLAAAFLGGCGAAAAGAVPELTRMLASRDQRTREYATKALRGIGPAAAAAKDELLACFEAVPEDQDWRRREILEALAAVAPEARKELPALEQMLAEREKPVLPADVQRQDAIAALLPGLQDADRAVRMRSLGRLAEMRAVEAISSVLPWLADDRPADERASAVHALIALDATQAVPKLRELLASKQAEVQNAAAHALAMFDDAESMPRVAEVLTEGIASASKDELWYLGLTQVDALAPALERIVADAKEEERRRWGATQALGYLRAPSSAPVIAAMLDQIAADEKMPDPPRQELLAVGLHVLAGLDAASHRERFARHAESVEQQVRNAALAGLALLGDEAARAALRAASPADASAADVPEAWRVRLEGVRLRLSEVRGNSLRDVLARLNKRGLRIEVSKQVPASDLDRRVGSMYSELIGYRPDALSVLGLCTSSFFTGTELVPRYHQDRIELLTPEEAGAATKR